MIDLHTHILPGIDDGAPDLKTALDMARYGQESGLSAIAATPHFDFVADWDAIRLGVENLRERLREENIGITLIPGAELFMDVAIIDMDAEQIPTYGAQGKYCLIELPMHQIPIYTERVFFALQAKGIVPIIAHPERYGAVVDDPNLALDWLNAGCLIQVNSGSVLGRFGAKIQETAKIMLTHNMAQFVASDAHGLKRRSLNLAETYDSLVELLGGTMAKALVQANPAAMLAGGFTMNKRPQPFSRRRRFFFF